MFFSVRREQLNNQFWGLVAVLVFLVAAKWRYLGLPSYWDEAYPYSYAIRHQVQNGISLLPAAMPSDYSTGHPTLYYFLQAGWNTLVGGNMLFQRLFPLLVACLVLVSLFVFTKRHFNGRIALFAVALLASRNVFFVQSSFQLPEMLITLLTVLTVFSYLEKKILAYTVFCSLLLWCKEPCYMIPLGIVLFEFLTLVIKRTPSKKVVKDLAILSVPFAFGFLFFLIQKMQRGWFFYPRHFSGTSVDAVLLFERLKEYVKFIAYYDFNFVIAAAVVLTLLSGLVRKTHFELSHFRAFSLFALCGLLFLLLSSMNRYTSYRYILCLFPFYFVFIAWLIDAVWSSVGRMVPVCIIGTMLFLQLYVTFNRKSFSDASIGYADRVKVQQQAIGWMQENGLQHLRVYANFLFMNNLRSEAPGYVQPDAVFTSAGLAAEKAEYFISTDCEPLPVSLYSADLKMVRSFEQDGAWVRIFKK